jgi:hypothetical protein
VIQESFISPQTIETISSTVSATISTAVAASVSSVMSSSIASSVGGSTSIPSASPAGLVSMIGVVQTMNMKMNMQVGGTPETFKGLAGGVGWINLDASFPGVKHRRMLLSESTNPYHSATSLFLYSYIFLLSISIPHYFYQRHKAKKQEKLQGMMHFPQLEFTIILLLINPYTKAAATLFTYDHSSSILAGIGMLLALPIPVLLFSIYIIYKNILEQHYAKFVVFGKIHKVKGFQNFIQRGLISTNKGHWKEEKDQLLDKYGIFFKSVRGPLYVFKDKEVRYDEKHKKYKWGKVRKVEDKLVYIRAFYKPYYILRNICTALLLNAFRYSTTGNVAQLILLILILTTHFYFMMFVSPFNTSKDQFTDLSSNMCELGTYVAGFGLLMARRFDIPFIALQMEKGMFVFQILSVAIQVLTQMWTVVVIAQIIKELFQKKLYYDHMIQEARKKLLLKKYTNRWLYKVHKKTLQGWTPPIGEEPKDRKAIIIYI